MISKWPISVSQEQLENYFGLIILTTYIANILRMKIKVGHYDTCLISLLQHMATNFTMH